MTTTLDAIQIPNKKYYILGNNWHCYVEPTRDDVTMLSPEDFVVQLCTYAVEAFFGYRDNETLTVMDKETDPMIGVVMAICDLGDEKNDDAYVYVPAFKVLGNCARFLDSVTLQVEYATFHKELEDKIKKEKQSHHTVKRHANSKPRTPTRYPNDQTPPPTPPSGDNAS